MGCRVPIVTNVVVHHVQKMTCVKMAAQNDASGMATQSRLGNLLGNLLSVWILNRIMKSENSK